MTRVISSWIIITNCRNYWNDNQHQPIIFLTQIRPQIRNDGTHNFVLMNRRMNNIVSDGFVVDASRNSVTFNGFAGVQQSRESLFFQLPAKFRGDQVTSYGGYLRFTLEFAAQSAGRTYRDVDVEIIVSVQQYSHYSNLYTHEGSVVTSLSYLLYIVLLIGYCTKIILLDQVDFQLDWQSVMSADCLMHCLALNTPVECHRLLNQFVFYIFLELFDEWYIWKIMFECNIRYIKDIALGYIGKGLYVINVFNSIDMFNVEYQK